MNIDNNFYLLVNGLAIQVDKNVILQQSKKIRRIAKSSNIVKIDTCIDANNFKCALNFLESFITNDKLNSNMTLDIVPALNYLQVDNDVILKFIQTTIDPKKPLGVRDSAILSNLISNYGIKNRKSPWYNMMLFYGTDLSNNIKIPDNIPIFGRNFNEKTVKKLWYDFYDISIKNSDDFSTITDSNKIVSVYERLTTFGHKWEIRTEYIAGMLNICLWAKNCNDNPALPIAVGIVAYLENHDPITGSGLINIKLPNHWIPTISIKKNINVDPARCRISYMFKPVNK